jgi:hypothetical protein
VTNEFSRLFALLDIRDKGVNIIARRKRVFWRPQMEICEYMTVCLLGLKVFFVFFLQIRFQLNEKIKTNADQPPKRKTNSQKNNAQKEPKSSITEVLSKQFLSHIYIYIYMKTEKNDGQKLTGLVGSWF